MTIQSTPFPIKIAHRGYKAKFPENTMASFKAALAGGAQMIELDVNLSKDGHLMVIHDPTLERTSSGEGLITDYTKTELQQLDAGRWFATEFATEKIPSLEEVLQFSQNKLLVNIEAKFTKHPTEDYIQSMAAQLVTRIESMSLENQILISSFNYQLLELIQHSNPSISIGVLSWKKTFQEILPICRSLKAFSWHPDYQSLDRAQIDLAHSNNLRVFTYTVNEQSAVNRLLSDQIDGIITDDVTLSI